jgi:hypothetical protein
MRKIEARKITDTADHAAAPHLARYWPSPHSSVLWILCACHSASLQEWASSAAGRF